MRPIPLILSFFFYIVSLSAHSQSYWQQKVDHDIRVQLDPERRSLLGFSKITYTNHSPDSLPFIWFHLWPNAYKNDRTALSEQLLQNGDTRFYFSEPEKKGYINQLDFRIGETSLKTEPHPEHIDILKVWLPEPLPPGKTTRLTTPFYVRLPYTFSRSGWQESSYQITQWYPKPAVYDAQGWHPMPYLDQGEFYADFGDYQVSITVPQPFTVAATGIPQQPLEKTIHYPQRKNQQPTARNWSETTLKTLVFRQENVHDFAWFADTTWTLQNDTVQLPSGKIIQAQVYFHLDKIDVWQNSLNNLKDALRTLSVWIGDYPYTHATVVDGTQGFPGGMEYPTITVLSDISNPKELDLTIFHEIGHNWFYSALASNERSAPWMDEGMNSYYEKRYEQLKYPNVPQRGILGFITDPRLQDLLLAQQLKTRKDQPISTPAHRFTAANYGFIAYQKAGLWMKELEKELGQSVFDTAMRRYFKEWQHKHPGRSDFQQQMERISGKKLDPLFHLLDKTGPMSASPTKPIAVLPFYRLDKIHDKQPVFLTPAAMLSSFNGVMAGLLIHNYSLPVPAFNMVMLPVVGLKTGRVNGWSRFAYTFYPEQTFQSVELSLIASTFDSRTFTDTTGTTTALPFFKLSPSLKLTFKEPDPRSTINKYLQLSYIRIREDEMALDEASAALVKARFGYQLLQSKFVVENKRILYPWKASFLAESHDDFYRLQFTGKYFFNFIRKGGVQLRFFTGTFLYKGTPGLVDRFRMQRYNLQLSGPKGFEDYAYSTPFISRFAYDGISSQQIIERDGFFKVRTDLLSDEVGRSDNWLSAVNLEMDVPDRFNILQALPVKIPLRLYLDIGTYGNAWSANSGDPRFLYNGGIQIPLLNKTINFYFPLIYSRPYRDYFLSVPGNGFFQRMSFSINLENLDIRKIFSSF